MPERKVIAFDIGGLDLAGETLSYQASFDNRSFSQTNDAVQEFDFAPAALFS